MSNQRSVMRYRRRKLGWEERTLSSFLAGASLRQIEVSEAIGGRSVRSYLLARLGEKEFTEALARNAGGRSEKTKQRKRIAEDLFRLLVEQDGKCAVCKDVMEAPCLDHDHKTGLSRGALCHRCNLLLGIANDELILLQNAVKYLSKSGQA